MENDSNNRSEPVSNDSNQDRKINTSRSQPNRLPGQDAPVEGRDRDWHLEENVIPDAELNGD